jgi:hypothetical protein
MCGLLIFTFIVVVNIGEMTTWIFMCRDIMNRSAFMSDQCSLHAIINEK